MSRKKRGALEVGHSGVWGCSVDACRHGVGCLGFSELPCERGRPGRSQELLKKQVQKALLEAGSGKCMSAITGEGWRVKYALCHCSQEKALLIRWHDTFGGEKLPEVEHANAALGMCFAVLNKALLVGMLSDRDMSPKERSKNVKNTFAKIEELEKNLNVAIKERLHLTIMKKAMEQL